MFNLTELRSIPLRHWKKIVFLPPLVVLLGLFVILYWPRTYLSEAHIFLQVGRESVGLDPTATTGQTIGLLQNNRKDEVTTSIEVIKGHHVIGHVVDSLGADVVLGNSGLESDDTNPVTAVLGRMLGIVASSIKSIDPVSEREEAIILIKKKLQVDSERDSTMIAIKYLADSPLLAQLVCNGIVTAFQKEHVRIHRNPESSTFFEDQRERLRNQLDTAMYRLRDAKNRMHLATIDGRRQTLESQVSNIELATYTAQQDLSLARAQTEALSQELQELPEWITSSRKSIPNQRADMLSEQLYAVQLREKELSERYIDSHPLLVAIRNQLHDAEQDMTSRIAERLETTNDINPIHRDLSLELKKQQSAMSGVEARLAKLKDQNKSLLDELQALNINEVELDQLEREVRIARTKFFKYAESLEQARINKELAQGAISNVSIAQPATLSEKPISPSKLLVALGTLVFSFAGTTVLVLASERLEDKLRTERDAEKNLEIPVFASTV